MKTCIKITFIVVGCLAIVGCASGYYIIDRYPISESSDFVLDLNEVRRLVKAGGGELPTEVRSLVVAELLGPAWAIMAGGGCEKIPFDIVAYQVVYPDGTVVIDSCFNEEKSYKGISRFVLRTFLLSNFNREKYALLQDWLKAAKLVLVTHEHIDHIGGIAASPYLNDILPKLLLSKEQVESPVMKKAGFPEGALEGYEGISYDRYYQVPVAPGIVLIKAPGHAKGQQMIFVTTKDGNEYLFLADVIWNRENLKRRVNRPYLVSLGIGEDLDPAREEIRWVLDNLYNNPNNRIIYIIPHDRDQLTEYIKAGVIKDGFEGGRKP